MTMVSPLTDATAPWAFGPPNGGGAPGPAGGGPSPGGGGPGGTPGGGALPGGVSTAHLSSSEALIKTRCAVASVEVSAPVAESTLTQLPTTTSESSAGCISVIFVIALKSISAGSPGVVTVMEWPVTAVINPPTWSRLPAWRVGIVDAGAADVLAELFSDPPHAAQENTTAPVIASTAGQVFSDMVNHGIRNRVRQRRSLTPRDRCET